jgi:hypothetical protein
MKTATLPAPRARAATTAALSPAPHRPMSKEQFDILYAELQRRGDKASIGDLFPSPLGGYVLKTRPFTEEEVYASY